LSRKLTVAVCEVSLPSGTVIRTSPVRVHCELTNLSPEAVASCASTCSEPWRDLHAAEYQRVVAVIEIRGRRFEVDRACESYGAAAAPHASRAQSTVAATCRA